MNPKFIINDIKLYDWKQVKSSIYSSSNAEINYMSSDINPSLQKEYDHLNLEVEYISACIDLEYDMFENRRHGKELYFVDFRGDIHFLNEIYSDIYQNGKKFNFYVLPLKDLKIHVEEFINFYNKNKAFL